MACHQLHVLVIPALLKNLIFCFTFRKIIIGVFVNQLIKKSGQVINKIGLFVRKPDFVACKEQSDQRLCFSLPAKYTILACFIHTKLHYTRYSKTCVKRPLKNRQNKGVNDKL